MTAIADDWTIQEGLQQPVGDDTCGECAAVYLAAKDGFIAQDFKADPESMLTYVAMVRQDLGMDPTHGGTTLAGEQQALYALAKRLGCEVDISAIVPTAEPNPDWSFDAMPGFCAIIGVDLNVLDPSIAGDHYLLFDANTGRAWHALDSCHDIDASLGVPGQWYDIGQVMQAAQALFGPGQQIGWLARFYPTGGTPMTPSTDGNPTERELLQQNALLTDLIKQIRTGNWTGPGSVDGIYCALKGGLATPDYTATFPNPQ